MRSLGSHCGIIGRLTAFFVPIGFLAGCGGGSTTSAAGSKPLAPTALPRPTATGKAAAPSLTFQPTSTALPLVVPESNAIKVACVGDSITFGSGTSNRLTRAYPIVLNQLLGAKYDVDTFGSSGATLLSTGTKPFQRQAAFALALSFKPDVAVILLGTNDRNMTFTAQTSAQFKMDYKAIIAAFKQVNAATKVYLCLPIPYYPQTDRPNSTLSTIIVPLIQQTAQETDSQVIDLNTPFTSHPELYTDGLHPNDQGANLLAATVYARFKATQVK